MRSWKSLVAVHMTLYDVAPEVTLMAAIFSHKEVKAAKNHLNGTK